MKNEEAYITECLLSILQQSSDLFQIEIIVVDDHSTDRSKELCIHLANADNRIKYFPNFGKGTLEALQTAAQHARGEFISRMDADDLMPANKLQNLFVALQEQPQCDLSTGKVEYFSTGKPLENGFVQYQNWLNDVAMQGAFYTEIYKECTVASPNWLIRREAFLSSGGFEALQYPEDYDLVFRWKKHQFQIAFVDEVTHLWRDHHNRASRNLDWYADNRFLELKLQRFLEQDYHPSYKLSVLGAGKKGKAVAKWLIDHSVPFDWYSNNLRKTQVPIYHQHLKHWEPSSPEWEGLLLIAVSSPHDLAVLRNQINASSDLQLSDCFFLF
ncbi:MAG: glycosyltransferase [Flavobacteriales bacterium]|nr:glycosyltransferase [Flavobacteriales bacterium]